MKILHVETGRHLYGGARQVAWIIEGLQRHGIENVLAAPADSDILATALAHCSDAVPLQTRRGSGFALYRELIAAIRHHRPDLIHIHSRRLAADFWGGMAARRASLPAVLSRRVDNPEARWVAAIKYRLFDHIITISDGIRHVLLSEGVPAAKVTTVRSAIDIDAFNPRCHTEAFQQTFELDEGDIVIAVIAQLIPRKGHRYLLDVLPEVIEQYPALKVIFFGQGPEEQALRDAVTTTGLDNTVQFAGFRDDLPGWLPCLDLVVHPADMEGLGISLIQAAACQVPIIASRAGGIPEIVHDGDNGILIEPGEREPLKQALLKLLANPEQRRAMGKKGRQLVEQAFSIDETVKGNLTIYQQLLSP